MNIVFCIIAVLFAFMGMLTRIGKARFLLRGFIKDYDKKKETYDDGLLGAFMAKIMYASAIAFAIIALGISIDFKWVTWLGIIIFFAIMVYTAKYTEDKEHFSSRGKTE